MARDGIQVHFEGSLFVDVVAGGDEQDSVPQPKRIRGLPGTGCKPISNFFSKILREMATLF